MMRRNDFKAIAEVLRMYHSMNTIDKVVFRDMVEKLSRCFRESNPTFDKGDFVKRCGFYQE